jgi:hypothetical protein
MADNEDLNPEATADAGSPPQLELDLWGPPPLLPGEDPEVYEALLGRVRNAVRPEGMIEEIYVRDLVDLSWEIRRWRRLRDEHLEIQAYEAAKTAFASYLDKEDREMLAHCFPNDGPEARREIDKLFEFTEARIENLMPSIVVRNLENVERLDALIATTEARRNRMLKEIDRHRRTLAVAALRRTPEEIEEADFEVVAPPITITGSE